MVVDIRNAAPEDYDRIISSVDEWWGGRTMAAMLPRLFFQHFSPWTFVAWHDSHIVGFLAGFRSQSNSDQVYCHFIGVAPTQRGSGIGEALYQRFFADAQAAGCREVLAVTSPMNGGSIAFHRSLGFSPLPGPATMHGTPYTPNYDGPGEDRVQFIKSISATA